MTEKKSEVPTGDELVEKSPLHPAPTVMLERSWLGQSFQMVRDLLKNGKSSSDIVRCTGLASQTVSNLRNEKSKKVTSEVYDRLRDYWRREMNGKTVEKSQGRPETDVAGLIIHNHVPANADAMNAVIDGLVGRFAAAVKELEGIRRELSDH